MTLTTEQVQAVLDRLRAGSTMKEEAEQLGMTYYALRHALEQVIGIEGYLSLMAAGLLRLPPSPNFLNEDAAPDPVTVGKPQGKTV